MWRIGRQYFGLFIVICAGSLWISQTAYADTSAVVKAIIGKTLNNNEVTQAVIYPDGSLAGRYNGISFAGEWRLEGGKYCREFHRGLNSAPACMDVTATRDAQGRIVSVTFIGDAVKSVGDAVQSRFDVTP